MKRKYIKEQNHPEAQSETTRLWTASRCRRLLRPLEAKLQHLRRSTGLPSQIHDFNDEQPFGIPNEAAAPTDDLLWPTSRMRKTYTAKRTAASALDPQASMGTPRNSYTNVALPTPFLARVRGEVQAQAMSDEASDISMAVSEAAKSRSSKRRERSHTPASRCPKEGAVAAFESLLEHTEEHKDSSLGPKSLVRTCVSALPSYIHDETRYRYSQDKDDKSDVSAETYDWLECFAEISIERGGCLRRAVRAHGISLIQRAILEGLFGEAAFASILELVSSFNARDAMQGIVSARIMMDLEGSLSAIVPHEIGKDMASNVPAGRGLLAKESLLWVTGSSVWPSTRSLLVDRISSPNDIYLPCMTGMRREASKAIAVGLDATEVSGAAVFMETYLLCSAGADSLLGDSLACGLESHRNIFSQPNESQKTTCRSVTGALCAKSSLAASNAVRDQCTVLLGIGCVGTRASDEESRCTSTVALHTIRKASLGVMRAYSSVEHTKLAMQAGLARIAAIIIMADLISLLVQPGTAPAAAAQDSVQIRLKYITALVGERRADIKSLTKPTHSLSGLLRGTAMCCETAKPNSGFRILRLAVGSLIDYRCPDEADETIAKQIALDAAISFANNASTGPHLAYARQIETAISERRKKSHTETGAEAPANGKSTSEVRWEEGLCEWVLATPAQAIPYVQTTAESPDTLQLSPLKRLRPRRSIKDASHTAAVFRREGKAVDVSAQISTKNEVEGQVVHDAVELTRSCKWPALRFLQSEDMSCPGAEDEQDELSFDEPQALAEAHHKNFIRRHGRRKESCGLVWKH